MKKIAIATMLAAASLASVAQVTIYGKLRAFEESVTVGSGSVIVI